MRALGLGGSAALLALVSFACTKKHDDVPPPAEVTQKAGSSVTNIGCLSGMTNAMSLAVRDLHFRTHCSRSSESGNYTWAYVYREETYDNGGGEDTVEKCIDDLATHLNDHIPYMEISLTERCAKRVKMFNGDRLVWAFDYGKRQ